MQITVKYITKNLCIVSFQTQPHPAQPPLKGGARKFRISVTSIKPLPWINSNQQLLFMAEPIQIQLTIFNWFRTCTSHELNSFMLLINSLLCSAFDPNVFLSFSVLTNIL